MLEVSGIKKLVVSLEGTPRLPSPDVNQSYFIVIFFVTCLFVLNHSPDFFIQWFRGVAKMVSYIRLFPDIIPITSSHFIIL